jgi:hypothetical protein
VRRLLATLDFEGVRANMEALRSNRSDTDGSKNVWNVKKVSGRRQQCCEQITTNVKTPVSHLFPPYVLCVLLAPACYRGLGRVGGAQRFLGGARPMTLYSPEFTLNPV